MNNIRRVWLVDVGNMAAENVDDYIKKFKEGLEGEGETAFVPIRPGSKTRIIELDRPLVVHVNDQPAPQQKKRWVFKVHYQLNDEMEAKRLAQELKEKIISGEYALPNGDLIIPEWQYCQISINSIDTN